MTKEDRKNLEKIFDVIGESVTDVQFRQFERYLQLLREWNKRTNLISRADEGRIIERHFAESLAVFSEVSFPQTGNLLDIGTGGGFPGVPIAILRPEMRVWLNDSKRMKVLFLREVISALNLKNAETIGDRCENISRDKNFSRNFHFVVTRAVGKLAVTFQWAKPLLRDSGIFIAWKGGELSGEVEELQKLASVEFVQVKEMDHRIVKPERNRCLVIVKI